tara:strand:- start:1123 stop:1464 length:342 start_codon:yes stop_codon:yes gene_type:complete
MVIKPQKTKFQIYIVDNVKTLNLWANNPWRKYSLALIVFFIGYFFGSSLGMISAVFELMDPISALVSVIFIEVLIKLRRSFSFNKNQKFLTLLIDFLRIGLFYGFFTEGLKLL